MIGEIADKQGHFPNACRPRICDVLVVVVLPNTIRGQVLLEVEYCSQTDDTSCSVLLRSRLAAGNGNTFHGNVRFDGATRGDRSWAGDR